VNSYTIHDLRRVFSTPRRRTHPRTYWSAFSITARARFPGVAKIYNIYSYMDEMRDAIVRWEAKLASIVA